MGLIEKILGNSGKPDDKSVKGAEERSPWYVQGGVRYKRVKSIERYNGIEEELINAGIESVPPEVAKSIIAIYRFTGNIEKKKKVSKLPLRHPAWEHGLGHYATMKGPSETIREEDFWCTVEESKKAFADQISENSAKISGEQYNSLPDGLRDIVDWGRKYLM